MAERKKKKKPRAQRQRERKKCMDDFKEKITEGQLATCYATINRQLSGIQAENPAALQKHMLSTLTVCISAETRLHFFFPKLHIQSLNVTPT